MPHRNDPTPQVTALELKFLLQLLMFPNYRAPISRIRPNVKTTAAKRDRLGQQLGQKGLVDFDVTVTRFVLTAAGRTLLTLDRTVLPITPDELLVLRSCRGGSVTVGQIQAKVPKDQRQRLVNGLAQRGLVKITKSHIGEVRLTDAGQRFLEADCMPKGHSPAVSWTVMSAYRQFLRQQRSPDTMQDTSNADVVAAIGGEGRLPPAAPGEALTPDTVLQMITDLDGVLHTENYLPIFDLRAKLQPRWSRQAVDQALYQLQREDRIDLSTLQDVTQYQPAVIASGIPQDIGGPLFFISVV